MANTNVNDDGDSTNKGSDGSDASEHSMRTRRRVVQPGGVALSSARELTEGDNTTTAGALSSGRMATRSRSPAPTASTVVAAPSSSGIQTAVGVGRSSIGTRTSGRRSASGSSFGRDTIHSLGDSGKEEDAAVTVVAPSRKRGRAKAGGTGGSGGGSFSEKKYSPKSNEDEDKVNDVLEKKEDHRSKSLVLLGPQPRGIYECDYCGTDLTRAPRIRCAVCLDFDLCLECLATEDHERMAKYKREDEARKRKEAARLAGAEVQETPPLERSTKRGRGGKLPTSARGRSGSSGGRGAENDGDEADSALGSYVGGVWVPYFRHSPDHGYLVADSTRYMLFPSFRGVREVKHRAIDIVSLDDAESEKKSNHPTRAKGGEGEEQKKIILRDINMDLGGVDEKGEKIDKKPPAIDATKATSKNIADVDANALDEGKFKKDAASLISSTNVEGDEKAVANAKTRLRVTDESKNPWTAEEDLRLLDAILTCGLGNWPDIAEHVNGGTSGEGVCNGGGTSLGGEPGANSNNNNTRVLVGGKTDKRCMERYLDDFMGRYGHILPPHTMVPVPEGEEVEEDARPTMSDSSDDENSVPGVAARKRPRRSAASTIVQEDPSAPGFKNMKFQPMPTESLPEFDGLWPHTYVPQNTGVKLGEAVGRDLWYRSEQSYVRQTAGAATKVDAELIRREFMARQSQGLAGYEAKVLPPRLEDMKQLPGSELAGYMPRRGDFDLEWDNDAERIISEMEFSAEDTKADRDLKLEVIRIFNAKLDERERRKRFVVERGLLNYRENQEKMWKMPPDERHLIQRLRLFSRFHSREEHEAFVEKVLEAKRLRKEISKLHSYRRLGITSLADAERYEVDKARRELHRTAWLRKEEERKKAEEEAIRAVRENSTTSGLAPPVPLPDHSSDGGAPGAAANQALQVWRQFKEPTEVNYVNENVLGKGSKNEHNLKKKYSIKDKPGYDLLSKREVGLCKRLRLAPQIYLDAKSALISESLAKGICSSAASLVGGQKNTSRSLVKIDVKKRDGIIDFVLDAGWIQTNNLLEEKQED